MAQQFDEDLELTMRVGDDEKGLILRERHFIRCGSEIASQGHGECRQVANAWDGEAFSQSCLLLAHAWCGFIAFHPSGDPGTVGLLRNVWAIGDRSGEGNCMQQHAAQESEGE
ncbi:MAG TPA: hypothetical protein VIL32_17915 [Steroidobacteraceae bacterium]